MKERSSIDSIGLRTLIENIGWEIRDVSSMLSAVEQDVISKLREFDDKVLISSDLQRLDLVIQTLNDLYPFTILLADRASGLKNDDFSSLLSEVRLLDLKKRLSGRVSEIQLASVSKDIEIF